MFKSAVAVTRSLAKKFLRTIVDPKQWFDVPMENEPEIKAVKEEPRKRSRRILELEKKQIVNEIKDHNKKENKRRDEELRVLRADAQRRRRDNKQHISGIKVCMYEYY